MIWDWMDILPIIQTQFAHFSTNKIVPVNQWMILMGLPQSDLDFGGWGGYRHLLLNSA